MYEESRNGGRGFAIYPSPGRVRPDAARLFRVLPRVEVGSPSPIAHCHHRQGCRPESQHDCRDRPNLSELRLSRHGFVFVVADDGTVIVPPPPSAARLLDSTDVESGRVLHTMLAEIRLPAA